jgi:rhodanese-related sulfurtransferase
MGTDAPTTIPAISIDALRGRLGRADAPWIVDVRKPAHFAAADRMIAGALRRPPDEAAAWAARIPAGPDVVVYCVHGREVSQGVAEILRRQGAAAAYLAGGFDGWQAAGGPTMRQPARVLEAAGIAAPAADRPTRWVTRARPKIDRVACPWLLRRFVDPLAEIHFVPSDQVLEAGAALGAAPFDIPGVAFSHDGPQCSFDAFLARFGLADPALARLAAIVRGADTGRLDLAPEAAGLLAVSLGLSALWSDDDAMLARGFPVYDALYAWARDAAGERHGWPPAA